MYDSLRYVVSRFCKSCLCCFFIFCCHSVSITCQWMLYWFNSVSGLFGVFELFRGASFFVCSWYASPLLSDVFLLVFFTAAPVVSVAAGSESNSTATGGELWAISVFSVDAFSAASSMSADAGAVLCGAEALGLVAMPAAVSCISGVALCHVCHVCVPLFSAGG